MTIRDKKRRKWARLKIWLPILLVLAAVGAYIGWDRGFREHPQPGWVTATEANRFMYGSIGAEFEAGIPYWIFYVLPRAFPEKLPGPGGYVSFGFPWEQGKELPAGFTKKRIGFDRVGNNCASCHTTRYRTAPGAEPVILPLGPGHTNNIGALLRFFIECAKDPRFNSDYLMLHIAQATKLDLIDTLLYRFLIIPITRKTLLEQEYQFTWLFNEDYPQWGRGRDDAMNLTKYFMIGVDPPDDGTYGPSDFPSIWNLAKYDSAEDDPNPQRLNMAGDTWDTYSVIMDSALGLLGGEPKDSDEFVGHVQWITDYAKRTPPPGFPFPIDEEMASAGKPVYDAHCASCHAEDSPLVGRPMPLDQVGTSPDRLATWEKEYAVAANAVVEEMGLERRGLVEEDLPGYNVQHLDGIWLRAPYLHNGSVPTLRDLLRPATERPVEFYRGYDVLDPIDVGFITTGPEAEKLGTLHDTRRKGNGNQGHEFGVELPDTEKDALLEYLKTL